VKTVPAGFETCGTLAFGIRVVRKDGTVLGWTEHSHDATVTALGESTELLANPGFNLSSIVSNAGLAVDGGSCDVIAGEEMTRADILARKWDGASVYLFRYNWKDPAAGVLPIKRGSFGNFKPRLGQFTVEFRDIRQALQPNSTWVLQEACRWQLGDARCGVDLAPFTHAGTVTAAASAYVFTASGLAQAADYFGEGEIEWLTGLNEGLRHKVRAHAGGGVFTLAEAAIYAISIGDTFNAIAGCRKRKAEDCRDKFDNILNYGGEADKPKRDDLMAPGQPEDV
jgi:uncharacterized phage protein (TIGR02218 family)